MTLSGFERSYGWKLRMDWPKDKQHDHISKQGWRYQNNIAVHVPSLGIIIGSQTDRWSNRLISSYNNVSGWRVKLS